MEISFKGRGALVTGAGKGIGRELVKALWASGAEVVALSRTSEDLESLVQEIVVRQMMERGVPGSIVNVSSILSQSAMKNLAIYCASKAALDMLTKTMALELGPQKIRVNCVNPTVVLTRMTQDFWSDPKNVAGYLSRVPLGRIAEFDDVINSILFLLSDKSAMITGTCLNVDGGFLTS